jgi:ubiquinone/menaquinone biosynthesis C-methylase UbiE
MRRFLKFIKTTVLPRHSGLGRRLRRIRTVLDKPHGQVLSEAELITRTEEFNRSAETYWQGIEADPTARANALRKPFATINEASSILYRLGIVLGELHTGPGQVVLDFGAGSGWLSACLNRLGCRTISMDVSATAVKLGRETFRLDPRQRPELDPQFVAYDGHRLPLPDESVDRVVCFDAFHHLPNPDEILAEIFRVLKTGGRAVFAEPGKGHFRKNEAQFDARRFHVLESGLDIRHLVAAASRLGFSECLVKPYPDAVAISLSAKEYFRLMDGADRFFPVDGLRRSLRDFHVFILVKGREVFDSRSPSILRAKISTSRSSRPIRGAPGESVCLALDIRNSGDTTWRHEESPVGGFVRLGGHLLTESGEATNWDFFRVPLPHSVPPGKTVSVEACFRLPDASGRYRLQLDLVDEGIVWFEAHGSPTIELELIVDSSS